MTQPKPCHMGSSHGLAIDPHGCGTWACPCRAQVKSNSEKVIFEGL
ncbi:hypothetical protein F383_11818 [Gossypium arboreum]|uniref:Uncharacterized protein n=1 Tax=Gossypium arboreum TaxID=29729 RepID=A0A0B0PW25_GOSAR|nr:hypothetical protein F383_11818 [Gossypium arboreum]